MRQPASRADVEELYRRHAGELRGYLYRRAGQAGADLLGEVFVVALQRLDDLPDPDVRRAWLFGVARRLLLAAQRDVRQRHDAEGERARFVEPADDHGADGDDADRAGRTAAVRAALDSLSEPDRELVRLTEWERLPIADAAVVLGLRPGTARVRLHRARRALAAHPALADLSPPRSLTRGG
ncbi:MULTISPECIES: RNA polymerase sigma factor [unclassified Nocardioides]|uniref:RNA polymerase sigma factor n=1 Tax=unclassified Nocardioides TaxID=2615069 RepID=UPI00138F4DB5|nr:MULTISPECIES: sigma-70 family RNA polymerase sigma factor [unclassified Nocardioides]